MSFSQLIIEEELIDNITPKSYVRVKYSVVAGKLAQVLEDTIAGVSIASDSFELSNLPEKVNLFLKHFAVTPT